MGIKRRIYDSIDTPDNDTIIGVYEGVSNRTSVTHSHTIDVHIAAENSSNVMMNNGDPPIRTNRRRGSKRHPENIDTTTGSADNPNQCTTRLLQADDRVEVITRRTGGVLLHVDLKFNRRLTLSQISASLRPCDVRPRRADLVIS